jgi:hypothetical protein
MTNSVSPERILSQFKPKFLFFSALLALSLASLAVSWNSVDGKYDSSGPCELDSQYTKVTRKNGSVETASYEVSYTFLVLGKSYSGKAMIQWEPSTPEATVFYLAENPNDNGLTPNRLRGECFIIGGIALVLSIIAYGFLPKGYRETLATPSSNGGAVHGDSVGEHLTIPRGKYGASIHVAIAFFGQVALTGSLITWGLTSLLRTAGTGNAILAFAIIAAVLSTLWVYSNRWLCIEAFSSAYCSGIVNLSLLYVPLIALGYANYHAFARLFRR